MMPTIEHYEQLTDMYLKARSNPKLVECLDDESANCGSTRETLEDFKESRKSWSDPGEMVEMENGLYFSNCRVITGQQLGELTVLDCGEFRLFYRRAPELPWSDSDQGALCEMSGTVEMKDKECTLEELAQILSDNVDRIVVWDQPSLDAVASVSVNGNSVQLNVESSDQPEYDAPTHGEQGD